MDTNNEKFNDVEKVGKRIQAITELIHDYGIPYHIVFMLLSDVCYLAEIADHGEHTSEENVSEYDDSYGDYGFEERDLDDEK